MFTDFHIFGDSDRIRRYRSGPFGILLVGWIPGPGTLQRKRIWEGVGGYCELLTSDEDWDYWSVHTNEGSRPSTSRNPSIGTVNTVARSPPRGGRSSSSVAS